MATMIYGVLSIIWGSMLFTKGFKYQSTAVCYASLDSCYPINVNDTDIHLDATNMTNKFFNLNIFGFILCTVQLFLSILLFIYRIRMKMFDHLKAVAYFGLILWTIGVCFSFYNMVLIVFVRLSHNGKVCSGDFQYYTALEGYDPT
jgi:hypothetical protein